MVQFVQAGWWIPGSLRPGWSSDLQANYNDMAMKFNELGIVPLVEGQPPFQGIGMYYSQAEYDFIQLLATNDKRPQDAQTIVAYSIWLASRRWAGTSPVPVLKAINAPAPQGVHIPPQARLSAHSIAGWYLLGSLERAWYGDVEKNLIAAQEKRRELGLRDCSPLYFTQCATAQTLQVVQSPWQQPKGAVDACQDPDPIQQYIQWWGAQGFGGQRPIPFMTPTLVGDALDAARKTP